MAEESKSTETKQASAEAKDKGKAVVVESDDELDVSDELEDEHGAAAASSATTATTGGKKKRSKRKKIKDVLTKKKDGKEAQVHKAIDGLTTEQVAQLLEMNPALRNEMTRLSGGEDVSDAFKRLNLQEIMTGLAASGKNVKDMGAYKFWSTQPVPKFGEDSGKGEEVDHPIKNQSVDEVPKEGSPLLHGFEWCEVDLEDEGELNEVRELLYGHYVEDDEEMFRFNYSASIMKWALMPPGWKKQWFVGVRASQSRRLVGFISAVPIELRVRKTVLHASEVNFLCIHKKLRSKRLAPVLIKEITRRCNLDSVWQALYTAGIVLPTPVSTCRYFHRAINWQKLYEVGFSPLPPNSKPQYQVRKYALPDHTSLKGLRVMQETDVDAVHSLLMRYLARFELAPEFSKEDIVHWLLHEKQEHQLKEQIMWSYVVEDENKKITDFFSFYCLESSILRESKHKNVRAAYLFYYATETGLTDPLDRPALKTRLQALMHDCLILCKNLNFDVLNALSLMDNGLFLEDLKFGPGDGQLHYYLFNYKAAAIAGGVDKRNQLDTNGLSGVGFTML